jgi:hypothetical protein
MLELQYRRAASRRLWELVQPDHGGRRRSLAELRRSERYDAFRHRLRVAAWAVARSPGH